MSGALAKALKAEGAAAAEAAPSADDDKVFSMAEERAEKELVAALEAKDPKRVRKALRVLRELDDD